MEHSYSKDVHPKGNVEVMATRSILIPRPPQCPSCYQHSTSDDILTKFENHQTDPYLDQLPPAINDNIAKMAMEETERLTKNVKNNNADDEDWDLKVNKIGWSKQQMQLYRQVSSILDYDQLSRLAVAGRPNEGIIRRCGIDKSVARMRLALASVHWNTELTQWLNSIMLTYLPPTYMASYLDILQSLRAKVPTLVDKMMAGRPANQEYLQAIMKRPWGANVPTKSRKLPGQSPIIVIIPSTLNSSSQQPSPRMKRWFSLLGTMASTAPIQHTVRPTQSLESITEQMIALTRSKVQDLRNEMPNRHIILVGINTGAAIAMQVALVEVVSSIVCMGFAFNTVKGTRGAPDDRILEITTPVLFILGENSARSSQEEIESLRERMSAQTSLVVVGSADDALRINKFNRHLEGVTQSMVDNMIADEIQDFVSTCIVNPPAPRKISNNLSKRSINAGSAKKHDPTRKRKHKDSSKADKGPPRKVGRPRLNRTNEIPSGNLKPEKPKPSQALLKQSNETIKMVTNQNIVPANEVPKLTNEVVMVTTNESTNTSTPNVEEPSIPENGINLNVSNTQAVVTANEPDAPKSIEPQMPVQANVVIPATLQTTPPKVVQQTGQFVQVKPPTTTTGRVQSPNVKNFFIRKGIEKQPTAISQIVSSPTGPTFITTTSTSGTSSPQMGITQLPANKKIIIKSQQILVPASNAKQTTRQILQVTGHQGVPGATLTIPINANVMESPATTSSSSSDLAGILDLPILFADNSDSTTVVDQTAQILNSSSAASTMLVNTSTDRNAQIGSPTNIFFSTTDGKLPNRPVVISAAKVNKPMQQTTIATTTTPTTSNKVIFINRNQIKQQIVGSQTMSGTHIVKGLPTLKLVPTSLATTTQSTPITLQGNQLAKLASAGKIDFSTLKLLKNASPTSVSVSGGMVKPLIINKAVTGPKGAIVIKSPMGGNVQTHQVLKGNVLNRNITVRKVMNVIPGVKQVTNAPITISSVNPSPTSIVTSPTQTNVVNVSNTSTAATTSPVTSTSPATSTSPPTKTTRKTRSSC